MDRKYHQRHKKDQVETVDLKKIVEIKKSRDGLKSTVKGTDYGVNELEDRSREFTQCEKQR